MTTSKAEVIKNSMWRLVWIQKRKEIKIYNWYIDFYSMAKTCIDIHSDSYLSMIMCMLQI